MPELTTQFLPLLAFAAFPLSILAWSVFQRRIRPLFIPRAEISRIADEMQARHGLRARQCARNEEYQAWLGGRSFEQGKWRRVGEELGRRASP